MKPQMAVMVPLVDLRSQPNTTPDTAAHDPLQETQLLYGERVRLIKQADGWAYVEATEQPEFTHGKRWQGYPGWLPASAIGSDKAFLPPNVVVTEAWAALWQDPTRLTPVEWRLPLGTRVFATDLGGVLWRVELLDGSMVWMRRQDATPLADLAGLSQTQRRERIVRQAGILLGGRYYWGGRSPEAASASGQPTGVDCSALVNLAYRAAGMDIPRDAHEQFMRAKPAGTLQPADLIFLSAREDPSRIVHVLLYAGQEEIIEGPGTGLAVRRMALRERFGRPLNELAPGTVIDGQTVSFGTYFKP